MVDATIFPANAVQLKNVFDVMALVLNMGPQNIAHVQMPILHTNTTTSAVLKHRRHVEDSILGKSLDMNHSLALNFAKPNDGNSSDKRRLIQHCLAVVGDSKASPWTPPSVVGPVPLIRVADMLGYDADSRPGATARAEQIL